MTNIHKSLTNNGKWKSNDCWLSLRNGFILTYYVWINNLHLYFDRELKRKVLESKKIFKGGQRFQSQLSFQIHSMIQFLYSSASKFNFSNFEVGLWKKFKNSKTIYRRKSTLYGWSSDGTLRAYKIDFKDFWNYETNISQNSCQ